MKSYPVITGKVSGFKISNCKCTNITFRFKEPNRVLIKGYVENPEGKAIPNAGVEIVRVDNRNNEEYSIGVVFTDKTGKYAVSIEVSESYDYKFNAYSPV